MRMSVIDWIRRISELDKRKFAFLSGFFYSLIGVLAAIIIFPNDVGLMSVAFTSMLSIPPLILLLKKTVKKNAALKKFSLSIIFKNHSDIFVVYIFLFLGIFLSYLMISLFLSPSLLLKYFSVQLNIVSGIKSNVLINIISNNLLVFVISFLLSFIFGAGGVLFLIWNASVWGVVLSFFLKDSLANGQILLFLINLVSILPHLITEATAYIGAAIVGGIVSKAILLEKLFSRPFNQIVTQGAIFLIIGALLVVLAAIIEATIFF